MADGHRYELRNRDLIKPPDRYGCVEAARISTSSVNRLRRKRDSKKLAIQKRIKLIGEMITGQKSRTKLASLQSSLKRVFQEAVACHELLLMSLDENDEGYDDEWIEELGIMVDTCASEVDEYLQQRQNDPPSSFTSPSASDELSSDHNSTSTRTAAAWTGPTWR